jgi:hypothetical protein
VIEHGARRVEGDAPLGGGPAAYDPDAERTAIRPHLRHGLLLGHHGAEAERRNGGERTARGQDGGARWGGAEGWRMSGDRGEAGVGQGERHHPSRLYTSIVH